MAKKQIILAGVGGQGLVSAGGMLAEAAAIYERNEALMGCAYGSEARGTFTKAEVIIDDKRIFFPEVQQPDIVAVLHQTAYDRYAGKLPETALLVYDSDVITPSVEQENQLGVPMSALADAAGAPGRTNMVVLGMISAMDGIVGREPLERLITKKFESKPKLVEMNISALNAGYKYAAKASEQ